MPMSRVALVAALNAAFLTDFATVKLGLFTNNIDPTDETDVGDLVVADYSGYAPVTVAGLGSGSYDNGAGDAVHEYAAAAFQPTTGATVTNVIFGWYLYVDASPDVILRVQRLPTPVSLESELDVLVVQPSLGLGQPQGLTPGVQV